MEKRIKKFGNSHVIVFDKEDLEINKLKEDDIIEINLSKKYGSKVWGIKEEDFFKLIKKLNEFYNGKSIIATQVFYENKGWFAIVYYRKFIDSIKSNKGVKKWQRRKPQ